MLRSSNLTLEPVIRMLLPILIALASCVDAFEAIPFGANTFEGQPADAERVAVWALLFEDESETEETEFAIALAETQGSDRFSWILVFPPVSFAPRTGFLNRSNGGLRTRIFLDSCVHRRALLQC